MDMFKANVTINLTGVSLGEYKRALNERLSKLEYISREDSIDIGSEIECATDIEQLRKIDEILESYEEHEIVMDNFIKVISKDKKIDDLYMAIKDKLDNNIDLILKEYGNK